MQVENDYDKEVYNGDLGVVSGIDMEEGELAIDLDGREVTYGFGELDELVLAYATTSLQIIGPEGEEPTTIEFARLLAAEIGGFVPPPAYS